jgi:4-aminobutyrate aminotransferase-like enzyme
MTTDATPSLVERRRTALAPSYQLFYDEPVELVRGEGVWLYDAHGDRYLDCYNNVPSVGHAHPRVVDALCRQAGLLNTHTRYLHPTVVELAERLGSLLPGELGICYFVCTGTEANDLAVQIARTVTGHDGVIVSESAYHGNSELVYRLSTDSYPASERPDWLGVVEPPNTYRGPYRTGEDGQGVDDARLGELYAAELDRAGDALDGRGHGVAAWMVDTSWDSNGVLVAPAGYVASGAEAVRRRGGLVIADEVQAGYCRLGTHFWGHTRYDVVPDIVTLGKPMGAGHPVAAVITTPAIATEFARRRSYFNTFGGNPVSAGVALAVLDAIEDEGLLAHATTMGERFAERLAALAARHDVIGNVQGSGLFWGLDLVADPADRTPIGYTDAKRLVNELRRRKVLAGITGRFSNVLKIRPPLPFADDHLAILVDTLDEVLSDFVPTGADDRRVQGAEW